MISCPPPWKWSVHASSDSWLQFHQFLCADKSVNPNNEYAWHIPCIDTKYPSYIPLFSLPSNNIKGWDLHPATASFCTLHILNRPIYVFERMNTRFYSENIQPVPKARWKCCVKFRTTPSLRTGLILLSPIASEYPFGPIKIHLKAKTSNA